MIQPLYSRQNQSLSLESGGGSVKPQSRLETPVVQAGQHPRAAEIGLPAFIVTCLLGN